MNIALIIAGGLGKRMNTKRVPKQFLKLHGKPLIIYTLNHFQKHKLIDGIVIVCVKEYIDYLEELIEYYNIYKVKSIVAGGDSGQKSIFNGLSAMVKLFPGDSVVLIHDAVRPLINEKLITDNIECCKRFSNAVTISTVSETVGVQVAEGTIQELLNRDNIRLVRAPQSFKLEDIYSTHLKASTEGRDCFVDSASMMKFYGYELNVVEGPVENIKITIPSDFYVLKSIFEMQENMQFLGVE